jgi:hypothetical protein
MLTIRVSDGDRRSNLGMDTMKPRRSRTKQSCTHAVRNVLDRISDRWSLLVLLTLGKGTLRSRVYYDKTLV